jgi:hypothetical protein
MLAKFDTPIYCFISLSNSSIFGYISSKHPALLMVIWTENHEQGE